MEENVSMFSVVGLLSIPALLSAATPQELTLQQVLKANTAAINALHSIHVTIEVSSNYPLPGEEKPPTEAQPTWIYEWYKDGTRERMRQNLLRGQGPHNSDASNRLSGYKALHNYDPNNLPSELSASRAGGELDKTRADDALGGSARAHSYIAPFPIKGGTLEAYVAQYPSSKLAATPATSRFGCYEITTLQEKPQVAGSSYDVKDVRIFVDPKVGFWVRRIEKGPWQKSTDPGDKGIFIGEVKDFKDCGNGIFWPLRIEQRTRLPGRTIGLDTFIHHTLHSINQPLPEEDFEVRFPNWLVVHDKPSGQVFIWGPDDKPRMTFASQAEFIEWDKSRMAAQMESGVPPRSRWIWLAGISLFVGLVLLLILWRRRTTPVAGGISQSTEKT
jgi:hypothetical protein